MAEKVPIREWASVQGPGRGYKFAVVSNPTGSRYFAAWLVLLCDRKSAGGAESWTPHPKRSAVARRAPKPVTTTTAVPRSTDPVSWRRSPTLAPARNKAYVGTGSRTARRLTGIAVWRAMPVIGSQSRSVLMRRLVLLPISRTRWVMVRRVAPRVRHGYDPARCVIGRNGDTEA